MGVRLGERGMLWENEPIGHLLWCFYNSIKTQKIISVLLRKQPKKIANKVAIIMIMAFFFYRVIETSILANSASIFFGLQVFF